MSGKTISTSETKVEALKLQSSAYGVTIPMVWGVTRISGNMLWYGGFKAVPHTTTQGGKGGGVRMQNTTFTYLASVMMGLCQGPIAGIPRIWRGKKLYSGGVTPSQVLTATESYTPPGSGAMTYTLAHGGTYVGMVAVTGTTGWGVDLYSYNLAQGTDYTVSAGVLTILAESQRGIALSVQYQYTSGAIVNTALAGLGLSFKAGALGQAVWSALSAFPTQKLGYSGLAYVAGQDYDLGTGAQVENHMFEVVGPMAYHLGSSVPDVDPSVMLRSLLTHAQGGAGMPPQLLDAWAAWSDYCVAAGLLVSPAITEQVAAAEVVRLAGQLTNTGPVWSGGRLKMVPYADSAESGNGRTFTPNTTPVYELDDTCYTPRNGDDPPVTVRLKSPASRFNHLKVEFLNRANQYNIEIAEAKDQADIDANGLRTDPTTVVAHWICEPAVARRVAQTLLQRSLFVGNEYVAPLPWHYALLEPMDLITLADARLEMAALPARIIVIEEAEDGDLTITAEDYPPGTASAALYPSQAGAGYTHDYNADPGSVQTPVIFEAPGPLSATGLEICVAVTGLGAAWGGCHVHASTDGSNYRQIGTIYGGSRYGKLGAAISGGNLPVVLESGQLASGSAGDAAALNTLCYIGGSAPEYCAYQTATLTSALHYTLSGLVRGAYRSNAASAHAVNDAFVRVDDAVARSGTLDVGRIGDTVYVKCTSFNIYGGGEQDLSAATAYTHVITGAMFGAEKTFRVAANGYSDTGHVVASGLYNGMTGASAFGATVARSFHLARVRRSDGVVTFSRQYDVYGAGAIGGFDAADLAADLDATGTDSLVVVFTYDDPLQNRLTAGLPSAMYRCGASRAVFGSPLFRSRGAYILVGIAGCGEGQGYEAYQGEVPSDTNAWVDVSFLLRNGNLVVSGTSATPRTLADYSYTGDLDASRDVRLVARGICSASGNNLTATGGGAWGSGDAYSLDSFTGGAWCSMVAYTTGRCMGGLNADPITDQSYTSIDFAIYAALGTYYVYESGTLRHTGTAFADGDVFAVVYDGFAVRYARNGTVFYTSAATIAPNLKLFFDSAFYDTSRLDSVRFGPMATVADIGTLQVAPGAINDPIAVEEAGPISAIGADTELVRVNFGPYPVACTIELSFTGQVDLLWGTTGPVNMYATAYIDLSAGASSQTVKSDSWYDTNAHQATMSLNHTMSLAANTSGWARVMGNVTVAGGGSPVGRWSNMVIVSGARLR